MSLTPAQAGLIVIDGVDGAGKGVQSRTLLAAMQASGLEVILTREPGGSPGAEEIRNLLVAGDVNKWDAMTELLLMNAARRSHLTETIWPALAENKWVISDRFVDSSRAFQGIAGKLGLALVNEIHTMVAGEFSPKLTLILDLDPKLSLARAEQRGSGEDRFEKKGLAYQQQVREGFIMLAQQSPSTHVLINADQSITAVSAEIFACLEARLGLSLCLS